MASDGVNTFLNKDQSRSYLNRDFKSFRADLLLYAQTFFPDRISDFSDPSVAGMLIDFAAYVGDVMSFYMDHQISELNIETAVEQKNIEKLVRSAGVKIGGASPSTVDVTFAVEVTAGDQVDSSYTDGIPYIPYLPSVKAGTRLTSNSGIGFELMEDLDFSARDSVGSLLAIQQVFGTSGTATTSYSLKLIGACRSGNVISQDFSISSAFVPFRTIRLSSRDVSEIIDVRDSDGNIYYEVDSLAQNIVYKKLINISSDSLSVPNNLELTPAPYRFTTNTNQSSRLTVLRFGSGRADTLDDDLIPDPSELALPLYEKKTFSRFSIDPNDLLQTRTLGISPLNTVITVRYRAGGGISHNVGAQTIRSLNTLAMSFSSAVPASVISSIRSSVEVINENPAAGGESPPTLSELRGIVLAAKNSQSRIVTREDLIARVYTMPPEFGRVFRVGIANNETNPLASLLYLVSRNSSNQLVAAPDSLQENLRLYLNENRLIADSIDFMQAYIINLKVAYNIVVDDVSNKNLVIQAANTSLKNYLKIENFQIDQPIILTDLRNIIINTAGVVSLVSFEVSNLTGTRSDTGNVYSNTIFDVADNTNRDILYGPVGSIFEIKYRDDDIVGMSV